MKAQHSLPENVIMVKVDKSVDKRKRMIFVDKVPGTDPYTGLPYLDVTGTIPCIGGRGRHYEGDQYSDNLELKVIQIRHAEYDFTEIHFIEFEGNFVERSITDINRVESETGGLRTLRTAFYSNVRRSMPTHLEPATEYMSLATREYFLTDGTTVTETFNEDTGFLSTRRTRDARGLTTETSFRRGKLDFHIRDEDVFCPDGTYAGFARMVYNYEGSKKICFDVDNMWIAADTAIIVPYINEVGQVRFNMWKGKVGPKASFRDHYTKPDGFTKVSLESRDRNGIMGSSEECQVSRIISECIADVMNPLDFEIEMLKLHFGVSNIAFIGLTPAIMETTEGCRRVTLVHYDKNTQSTELKVIRDVRTTS